MIAKALRHIGMLALSSANYMDSSLTWGQARQLSSLMVTTGAMVLCADLEREIQQYMQQGGK